MLETEVAMSKSVIIYYSHTNNTKRIAEQIQKATGADIAEIKTVEEYTGTYDEILEQGKTQVESGYCPAIYPLDIDMKNYDRVILGTPVWWYTHAPAIGTFLKEYDLTGKRLLIFATNGGWLGHTVEDIEKAAPGAEVENYINIQFNENVMATPKADFERWVAALVE